MRFLSSWVLGSGLVLFAQSPINLHLSSSKKIKDHYIAELTSSKPLRSVGGRGIGYLVFRMSTATGDRNVSLPIFFQCGLSKKMLSNTQLCDSFKFKYPNFYAGEVDVESYGFLTIYPSKINKMIFEFNSKRLQQILEFGRVVDVTMELISDTDETTRASADQSFTQFLTSLKEE
ncbi:MAG: hypothetical protein JST24_07265 [Acidobacteria bacterium]|nr:hypothetical protein [Acidobacteriota bacterium]